MRHALADPPTDCDVDELASRATYVGSAEHKTYPSFAGPPKRRADASKCDPSFQHAETLTEWLRDAIVRRQFGAPWEGGFPRYVWYRNEGAWYEGRLVNRQRGDYKGYPVQDSEVPPELWTSSG